MMGEGPLSVLPRFKVKICHDYNFGSFGVIWYRAVEVPQEDRYEWMANTKHHLRVMGSECTITHHTYTAKINGELVHRFNDRTQHWVPDDPKVQDLKKWAYEPYMQGVMAYRGPGGRDSYSVMMTENGRRFWSLHT